MNGGDTPLEYTGHISSVFVAEYKGIANRDAIEEKDLDPKISENGKFYPITKIIPYLRKEHIDALLNSPYVLSSVKGAIRILDKKNNPLKRKTEHYTSDDIVGGLFFVSKNSSLEKIEGSNHKNGSLHINTRNNPIIRVFNSIDEALTGYDSVFGGLKSGDTIYAYAIDCKIDCVDTPSNEESPSSKITGELWIRENHYPIKVKRLGLVRVISTGVKDRYYYGKNSTIVGEIEKFKHEWIVRDKNVTNVMENSVILPNNNKLYHGSTYLIEEFKPMSLDLGNAQQEPGWSTFAFADYTLALRFGLMRSIQKVKDYYRERCIYVVCSWDVENKKPFISAEHYKLMKPLITDFKYYVYTIDATNLDVGIGNDENFPEYTFRESGVVPENTDIIKIDGTLLEQNLIVLPVNTDIDEYSSTQERSINGKHNRGWYAVMMTKDYNNGLASAQLQKAVKDGKLKPGDDIALYMRENGIAFDDDSISMKEYSKEGVSEAISGKSSSRNDILDKIKQFHLRLSAFDYFIVQENGRIDYTASRFMEHRTLTPSQFEKYEGGICWDYVPYQVDYFKKHFKSVKTKSFFHVFINDKNQPTHTFMLFYLNHKVYYFECSWKPMMGIYEFSSEDDALSYVVSELYKGLSPDQRDCVYDKYTLEYNSLDTSLFGLNCVDYMNYMGDKIDKSQGICKYSENKLVRPAVIQKTTVRVENNKPIISLSESAEYSSVTERSEISALESEDYSIVDKRFKPKGTRRLSDFKKLKVDDNVVKRYKNKIPGTPRHPLINAVTIFTATTCSQPSRNPSS